MHFFFNDTATTEIYTLSLHTLFRSLWTVAERTARREAPEADARSSPKCWLAIRTLASRSSCHARCSRSESTRLNSSHMSISYAVFCLKKKKLHTPLYSLSDYTLTS